MGQEVRWEGSEGKAFRKRGMEVGKHWEEGGQNEEMVRFLLLSQYHSSVYSEKQPAAAPK